MLLDRNRQESLLNCLLYFVDLACFSVKVRQEQELRNGGTVLNVACQHRERTTCLFFGFHISLSSFVTVQLFSRQVYHDSEEGQRYIQFYKLNKFPYISILDPRTGQKMVEWNQLDVASFMEQATGFLAEHGQLDGPSSNAPPAKRARSESLIDASEDSQLEAAIRASLQETHYDSSNVLEAPDSPRSEDESDAEPFSDSEGPISVDGSDSETPAPHEEKSSTSKHTSTATVTAAQQRLHPDSSTSSHRKSPYKENNHSHKKEESKKNHLEPSAPSPLHPQPEADSGGNHCSSQTKSAGTSNIITTTCDVDCPDDNGMKKCKL
ncbi:hypothetical protein GOODEAATRI_007181 [Goodea atripinnis]|uniref:UAS domain-containing protein n=1 Tax=Goodea atripinnis TaxID=208336 RepID=A0ABV0PLK6_9TELE